MVDQIVALAGEKMTNLLVQRRLAARFLQIIQGSLHTKKTNLGQRIFLGGDMKIETGDLDP